MFKWRYRDFPEGVSGGSNQSFNSALAISSSVTLGKSLPLPETQVLGLEMSKADPGPTGGRLHEFPGMKAPGKLCAQVTSFRPLRAVQVIAALFCFILLFSFPSFSHSKSTDVNSHSYAFLGASGVPRSSGGIRQRECGLWVGNAHSI